MRGHEAWRARFGTVAGPSLLGPAVLVGLAVLAGCDKGAIPRPFLGGAASNIPAITIPGVVLQVPSGGRGDVQAIRGPGLWSVMLQRRLAARPFVDGGGFTEDVDLTALAGGATFLFSLAAWDARPGDAATCAAQDGAAYSLGIAGTGADLVAVNETPGSAVAGPGGFTGAPLVTAPANPALAPPVALRAAYDNDFLYLLATWADPSGTASLSKGDWRVANLSRFGEEDSLAILFGLNDPAFGAGGQGCAGACHADGNGTRLRSSQPGASLDLWHWQAARSDPLHLADDQHVIYDAPGGTAPTRIGDFGRAPSFPNEDAGKTAPLFEAEGGWQALHLFAAQRPLDAVRPFNPDLPAKDGDTIRGWVQQAPSGSRSDLAAQSSFTLDVQKVPPEGRWRVEITRPLVVGDELVHVGGHDYHEDVQFAGLASGTTYDFSAAVLDAQPGFNVTMWCQDVQAWSLGNETSFADLRAVNETPAGAFAGPGGFTGTPIVTQATTLTQTLCPTFATDFVPITIWAAYDGTNLYLLAEWRDKTDSENTDKTEWSYNAALGRWIPGGVSDDLLAIMWDVDTSNFGAPSGIPGIRVGCNNMCHPAEVPGNTGRMRTPNPGESIDLWVWQAGRGNVLGAADDYHLIWDEVTQGVVPPGGPECIPLAGLPDCDPDPACDPTANPTPPCCCRVTRVGDEGRAPAFSNLDTQQNRPAWMGGWQAPLDPTASLVNAPYQFRRAVPYVP